nr:hypothetical protein [uncultured Roseateles sp.]
MKKILLSLLCGLCVPAVWAQAEPDTDIFNGKWKVSVQAGSGRPSSATLLLTNFSGTWSDPAASSGTKPRACKGTKFPVTVQNSKASELEFTAWGSAVSPACPDISVTVKPVSAKLLEGTLATGEMVKLTRP